MRSLRFALSAWRVVVVQLHSELPVLISRRWRLVRTLSARCVLDRCVRTKFASWSGT
jgi:hypothetical protein